MNNKIKILIYTGLFCVFLLFGAANKALAATITAASCSYTDVNYAVNTLASRGDIVNVPAGNCTWLSELVITKAIKFKGAGIDATIITASDSGSMLCTCVSSTAHKEDCPYLIYYSPSSPAGDADANLEITGFTFDEAYQSGGIFLYNPSTVTAVNKIKIHGNKFLRAINKSYWNTSYAPSTCYGYQFMKAITVYGLLYGVIYENTFTGRPSFLFTTYPGSGATGWHDGTYTPGTAQNMYFEDNTVIHNDSSDYSYANLFLDSGWGGRFAVRYNTFNHGATATALFMAHGNSEGGGHGNMGGELYGNYITSGASSLPFYYYGGQHLAFYNYYNSLSTKNAQLLEQYPDTASDTGNYCPAEIEDSSLLYPFSSSCSSAGQPQHIWRSYFVNNRRGENNSLINITPLCAVSGKELRGNSAAAQYYTHSTSFSGANGVGCGTLANRPTTCTIGVGYWATNQSCSEVTIASRGANPSVPLSGTLYRCTLTNTWQVYYTPYTYPHPLRSGITNTAPAAPTGVRVI